MDSDQKLLDDGNSSEDARRAAERKKHKAAQQWYENAAKKAHKIWANCGPFENKLFAPELGGDGPS